MMKKEIEVAAEWWAEQLRTPPVHDNGERFQSAFATLAASHKKPPTKAQISDFKAALAEGLAELIKEYGVNRDIPMWGSELCCFGTNYEPDMVLRTAADKAGLDSGLRFPIKTLMWIDLGRVSVAKGYGAKEQIIYCGE